MSKFDATPWHSHPFVKIGNKSTCPNCGEFYISVNHRIIETSDNIDLTCEENIIKRIIE
jgi:hypothetical protein